MKQLVFILLCYNFCRAQYYESGFVIEGDPTSCFCADRIPKSTPLPMILTLHWYYPPINNVPSDTSDWEYMK